MILFLLTISVLFLGAAQILQFFINKNLQKQITLLVEYVVKD